MKKRSAELLEQLRAKRKPETIDAGGLKSVLPKDPAGFSNYVDRFVDGEYNSILGKYLDLQISSSNNTLNHATYGTKDMPATKIISKVLQNKQPQVTRTVTGTDGEPKKVVDEDKTAAALGKAEEIQDKFLDWLWHDQDRRQTLSTLYNERFNRRVQQKYDGSYLTFPGKSTQIRLRPHQTNFVTRSIQKGKGLADHVVGAGKTFASIATAMEMRRLGLAKKPLFTVPNHLVDQWAKDFKILYPGSNVLAASKKDFEGPKRREFFAKIATGDWDAVIVAHSSFGFMSVPRETEMRFLTDQVNEMNDAIDEARRAEGQKSRSVRDMEKLEGKTSREESKKTQ